MAIINCKECGKKISDQSPSCVNCGIPVKPAKAKSRPGGKWEGIGFLLLATGLVMMIAGKDTGTYLLIGGFIIFLIGRFK